ANGPRSPAAGAARREGGDGWRGGGGGFHGKPPPPTTSATGRRRCRAAGHVADRSGASLSDAAGAHRRRLSRRRRCGPHVEPAGAVAGGSGTVVGASDVSGTVGRSRIRSSVSAVL